MEDSDNGLFIGNLGRGQTAPTYINSATLSGHKVWGVTFDGTSSAGVRLYDAIGLNWTVSSAATAGIDDFTLCNNGDALWSSGTQNEILMGGCAWNNTNGGGAFAWTSYDLITTAKQFFSIRLIV